MKYKSEKPQNNKLIIPAVGLAAIVVVAVFMLFGSKAVNIGTDRQFMWNDAIVDTAKTTATLTMHAPQPQEIVIDGEAENLKDFSVLTYNNQNYMYYIANKNGDEVYLLKSGDGIKWEKSDSSVVLTRESGVIDGFSAFADDKSAEPFKAVCAKDGQLISLSSADGIKWNVAGEIDGKAQNIHNLSVAYNEKDGKYYCYYSKDGDTYYRTSKDFSKWTGAKSLPLEKSLKGFDIASVNISSYYRQAGALIGFPVRNQTLTREDMSLNFGITGENAISDTLFVSSTDGGDFTGLSEAWLTAGPQSGDNWLAQNNAIANGVIKTPSLHSADGGDDELSLFAAEQNSLRRYTMRIDGFASYSSGYNTTKLVTKPVKFSGDRLTINFSTSNAGYVFVRILDKSGKPFKSLSYTDENGNEYKVPSYTSYQMFGDRVDREVAFNADLSKLKGKTVVLEFYLSDADLYSFRFDNEEYENTSDFTPIEIPIRSFDDYSYGASDEIINIGTDRQLFVDDYIVDTAKTDAVLTNHSPVRREKLFDTDLPWEGDNCDFYVIMEDEDKQGPYYRMYYLGWSISAPTDIRVCYAYSYDGKEWIKPNLGLYTYTDKKTGKVYTDTNIMLYSEEDTFDNFFVMKDPRPDATYKYLAVAQGNYDQLGFPSYGLWAWVSQDGIHWTKTHRVLPQLDHWFGSFDSVNTLTWDEENQKFFTYFRVRESQDVNGVDFIDFRKIYGAEGPDFKPFDEDTIFLLNYGENAPLFELYTNNISKYYRADQLFIGFPTRFTRKVEWEKNYEYLTDPAERRTRYEGGQITRTLSMTETMFMTSRDGYNWNRQNEAWLTPGAEYNANWIYGNCYPAYGLIQTKSDVYGRDDELSTYVFDGKYYTEKPTEMYRYTFRIDGFKSYKGDLDGQRIVTKPFVYDGGEMLVNFSTSAVGSVVVNMLDENGKVIATSEKLIGDNVDRNVAFKDDIASLSGTPVRLEFVLKDAQVYSFKFQ